MISNVKIKSSYRACGKSDYSNYSDLMGASILKKVGSTQVKGRVLPLCAREKIHEKARRTPRNIYLIDHKKEINERGILNQPHKCVISLTFFVDEVDKATGICSPLYHVSLREYVKVFVLIFNHEIFN